MALLSGYVPTVSLDYSDPNNCICPDSGGGLGFAFVASGPAVSQVGEDIDCLTDIQPAFTLTAGRDNLAKALARRFMTPRGWLFEAFGGDADYGLDVREWLHSAIGLTSRADLARKEAELEDEARKDARVRSVDADLVYDLSTGQLTATLQVEDDAGPFELVLAISAVTVQIVWPSE